MSGARRGMRRRSFFRKKVQRAGFRPSWRVLAPNRSMRWWTEFAHEVKLRRIRGSDTDKLRMLVPIIDARLGYTTNPTTNPTTTGE